MIDGAMLADTEFLWPVSTKSVYIEPQALNTIFREYNPNTMHYQSTGASLYNCLTSFCRNIYGGPAGYMIYGPYATDIPSGLRRVQFDVAAWTNSYPSDKDLLRIDVYNASTGQILNRRVLRMVDIPSIYSGKNSISLHYTQTAGNSIEYRVWRYENTDMVTYKISVF